MADMDYGKDKMDQYRHSPDRVREPTPSFELFPVISGLGSSGMG